MGEASEVTYLCTAGTTVGDKIVAAFDVCMPSTMGNETESRKKPSKPNKPNKPSGGNGENGGGGGNKPNKPSKGCPKVADLEDLFMKVHKEHLCMFSEMGWLDASGSNFDNATAMADILSLPAGVAGPTTTFSWTGVTECIQESLAMAATEQWFVKCESKYSAEELERITELATATAAMKCFLDDFNDSCRDFVRAQIMASAGTAASG